MYFLNLEFRNILNKAIKRVELEEGESIHKQSNILNHVKQNFEKLYIYMHPININLEEITNVDNLKLEPDISSSLEPVISGKRSS